MGLGRATLGFGVTVSMTVTLKGTKTMRGPVVADPPMSAPPIRYRPTAAIEVIRICARTSPPRRRPRKFRHFRIDDRCMRCPRWASSFASKIDGVFFPTPPLEFITAMVNMRAALSCGQMYMRGGRHGWDLSVRVLSSVYRCTRLVVNLTCTVVAMAEV